MQIQFCNLNFDEIINNNFSSQLKNNKNTRYCSSSTNDIFIKKHSDISFEAKNRKEKVGDLPTAIAKSGVVAGGGFLLGLVASVGMSRQGQAVKDLIFNTEGYETSKDGIFSDDVVIDAKNGIIKIGELGIDTSKCDTVDWDNGVFKSYDGKIDIDLLNNKYIDTENGIFVDPEAQIAAVLDGDHFENIAIPDFGPSFGTSMDPKDHHIWTPEELEKLNEPSIVKDGVLKTVMHNLSKLFNPNSQDNVVNMKDIFGNNIIQTSDAKGDTYLTSMPEVDKEIFENVSNLAGSDKAAVEIFNNAKLSSYLDANYPNFGTRVMVYEGGRNAGVHFPEIQEKYNMENVNTVLHNLKTDGGYYPDPGSPEAVDFAKYQNEMLKHGLLEHALIPLNRLLDVNGDGKPDIDLDGDGIADYDMDGDGKIDFSSKQDNGIIHNLFESLKDLWPF